MLQDLDARILATLGYAGLFGAGLNEEELRQRLFGARPMHAADVREALERLSAPGGPVVPDEGRYTLAAPTRVAPAFAVAATGAPGPGETVRRVEAWARRAGSLPFIRFLGLTGSLAKGAPDGDADVLVVAAQGRAYLAFALLRTIGRWWARAEGLTLCLNYVVDESHLELAPHDAFTATEFVTIRPLWDRQTWSAVWLANRPWVGRFCGSATQPPPPPAAGEGGRATQQLGELLLIGPIGALLDGWCRRRKRRRLERQLGEEGLRAPEVICEPGLLKHHVSGHRGAILDRFARRLEELRLDRAWITEAQGLRESSRGPERT